MRIQKSLKAITTGLVGQIITLLTGFAVRTVFIYCLGATYLGVSGLFSNVLTVLSFAELGVGQAIVFSLYKPIANSDENTICSLMRLYAKIYRVLFVVVLIIGIALLPLLPYIIKDIDSIPNLRAIYLLYLFNSAVSYLFSYRSTFVTACQMNYVVNIFGMCSNFIMSVLQIVALLLFKNYFIYLAIQIISGIVQNGAIYLYAGKKFPYLRSKNVKPLPFDELKKIKDNVKALVLYKIGTISLNSTDNIIISAFCGIVTVGQYSNYLLLQTSTTAFLSIIFSNLTPSIGNLNACETKEKRFFMFNVINFSTFWLYTVCAVCLYVCMTPFINIWIGNQYALPDSVSLIMAINVYIAGMLFSPFNYRQTMGLFVDGKMRPIISAIINIVVSVGLAMRIGLTGVLLGTAIARLLTNVWFDPYLVFKKGLGMSPALYFIDYIKKLAIFLILLFVCHTISMQIPDFNIGWLFIKGIITFLLCNLTILAVYCRSKEFKYLLSTARAIIKKKI